MQHHASNQRRAVCLILGPPPFHSSHSSWTSCLTTPQLPNQYYKDTEIPPPAYQPVCPPLPFCSILSIMSQSFSLLSSQQDAPPSGNLQQGSARLLKGPDESATTAQWRQRCRREKEGVRSGKEEWDRLFGLVDGLLLQSQRAPLLSADVDNGAAVVTEDEGGMSM